LRANEKEGRVAIERAFHEAPDSSLAASLAALEKNCQVWNKICASMKTLISLLYEGFPSFSEPVESSLFLTALKDFERAQPPSFLPSFSSL